eukprot:scaffold20400_cov63-Phaeocystis_antarctica.AAC.3
MPASCAHEAFCGSYNSTVLSLPPAPLPSAPPTIAYAALPESAARATHPRSRARNPPPSPLSARASSPQEARPRAARRPPTTA